VCCAVVASTADELDGKNGRWVDVPFTGCFSLDVKRGIECMVMVYQQKKPRDFPVAQ
jgi:hypothetical protein